MTLLKPGPDAFQRAAQALHAGEVVGCPTETVYGLCVDPFNEEAVSALFDVKGRDDQNPVLLVVAEIPDVLQVAAEVSVRARRLMERFWPGPLSLVLPRAGDVPGRVTAGRPKVSVRCPAHDYPRALCRVFGGPLTSTSANRSGEPPATDAAGCALPGVSLVIDGGVLMPSAPSTVYDPDEDRVFREGALSAETIRAAL
jgi:L-threonylcarbamoyladenylate synthase